MQALVVDPVEVRDLVHQCGVHFVPELHDRSAGVQMRLTVEDDPVGQLPGAVTVALCQRQTVVETEQVEGTVLGPVLDDEDDVVESDEHALGQQIEFVGDESFERVGVHLDHVDIPIGEKVGCLSSTFGNSAPKTKTLVNRLDRGVYEVSRRPQDTAPKDDRGPVVRTVETAQTFLTAAEVDALVGDYLAGMSVKALAERYGIHRATVFAHLRRRNVPSRRPGLGIDEKAEAVRLARAGVSMRAIGRRMGVDRKAVRAALVEAGLIVDEASDDS